MSERAIFLFDGPNFYKNLKAANLLNYHIDYNKLASNLTSVRGILPQNIKIIFFTSPTDSKTDPVNYKNQQKFFSALKRSGIQLRLGKLEKRTQLCPICNKYFPIKTEKSVDVQIAMTLVLGAIKNEWDIVYIATCDSDLIPAINFVISQNKKVFLMLPQNAKCYGVAQVCSATIPITSQLLQNCQLYS